MVSDEKLRRAFSRGNYCSAYETEDFALALAKLEPNRAEETAAFTLGFFATYENHEIPSEHQEAHVKAYQSDAGQLCVRLGLCEARTFET